MQNYIFNHKSKISRLDRIKNIKQQPMCLWLTGLSGSGKSTIAFALEERLFLDGFFVYVLDGDNLRAGLNKDLSFNDIDRFESVRRTSEIAKIMVDAGFIVVVSLISPFKKSRDEARSLFSKGQFFEIFIDAPLETCIRRDPKNLYAKANKGVIKDFTGLTSDYENPKNPELHLLTEKNSVNVCVEEIMSKINFYV